MVALPQDKAPWPLVLPNDDGIRPAGPPDECFYCHQKVGQPHGRECVVVTKRIRMRYSYDIEIDVPYFWDADQAEFHHNESSSCAGNTLVELAEFEEFLGEGNCLCEYFTAKYLDIVDDTPRGKTREKT